MHMLCVLSFQIDYGLTRYPVACLRHYSTGQGSINEWQIGRELYEAMIDTTVAANETVARLNEMRFVAIRRTAFGNPTTMIAI